MANKATKAAVIGLWHLGSTIAASLAKSGFKVQGFDFDEELVSNLNHARLPVAEPGLSELTLSMLKKKQLGFSFDFSLLKNYPYIIIAYDTPVGDDDRPDLTIIKKAVEKIAKFASPFSTVIIMSQVPVKTSRQIYARLRKKIKGLEVVYNPENLRLSQAIETYLQADRQIIGLSSKLAKPRMEKFYAFYKNPLMFMSLESAELVKHGINSFLAASVSFINQIADLSEAVGGDIMEIVKGIKSDSRIGQKAFLSPGLGFAGGTLGRDLRVLEALGSQTGVDLPLIKDIYNINQARKNIFFGKLKKIFPKLAGKKFAIWGLVYKPGTNTLRRSLSLEIGRMLVNQKVEVSGFDPALTRAEDVLPVKLLNSAYQAAEGADALIIVTEWPEFKSMDFKKVKKMMRGKVIFDTKNILPRETLIALGFDYYGTGLGKI